MNWTANGYMSKPDEIGRPNYFVKQTVFSSSQASSKREMFHTLLNNLMTPFL